MTDELRRTERPETTDDPLVVASALEMMQYHLDAAEAGDWEMLEDVAWQRLRRILRNARRLLGADLKADDARRERIRRWVRRNAERERREAGR